MTQNDEIKRLIEKAEYNIKVAKTADYDHMEEITKEQAEKILKNTEYFVAEIKKKLVIK